MGSHSRVAFQLKSSILFKKRDDVIYFGKSSIFDKWMIEDGMAAPKWLPIFCL